MSGASRDVFPDSTLDTDCYEGDIIDASDRGSLNEVMKLLREGVDPNTTTSSGWSALLSATINGNEEIVRELLEYGADPNTMSPLPYKRDVFSIALTRRYIDVCMTLLEYGADPNRIIVGYNISPLSFAIRERYIDLPWALLDHGADPNTLCGETPLVASVTEGNLSVVKTLLHRGADPNAPSGNATPLLRASQMPSVPIFRVLLEWGAIPDEGSEIGNITPAMIAAYRGDIAKLRILCEFDADFSITSSCGRSPLWYALVTKRDEAIRFLNLLDAPLFGELS